MSTAASIFAPQRQLDHYPATRQRTLLLAIVLLATIAVSYQTYIQGAVSTDILTSQGMSLRFFALGAILGNAVGALAAYATGIADRFGRAPLVIAGLGVTSILSLVVIPTATDKVAYVTLYVLLSLVDGMILVATSAMVRDFSPQLGRASAMSLWTLGPVLGNLLVASVSGNTLDAHPDWQFQYRLCGIFGLFVFFLAVVWLRELAPAVRNQLLVTWRERVLVEARAEAIREGRAPEIDEHPRVWRPELVLPALGIGLFLMFYVTRVGYFTLFYVVNFHYTPAQANHLATWYWVSNAICMVAAGWLSDRLRVRKPIMVVGAVIDIVGLVALAFLTTQPSTSYGTFVVLLVAMAAGGALVNCCFLTLFSETVERISPAATARGMAVYGSVVRVVVTGTLIGFITVVSVSSTLVDHGAKVTKLAKTYQAELATIAKLKPATQQALKLKPRDPRVLVEALSEISGVSTAKVATVVAKAPGSVTAAEAKQVGAAVAALTQVGKVPGADLQYLAKYGAAVKKAAAESPSAWQRWWWICLLGQVAFLPLALRMRGRWSPRKAADDARERDAIIDAEMAKLA